MPTNYPNRWRALAVIRGGLHAPWTFADMRGGARPLVCIHGRLQAFTELQQCSLTFVDTPGCRRSFSIAQQIVPMGADELPPALAHAREDDADAR